MTCACTGSCGTNCSISCSSICGISCRSSCSGNCKNGCAVCYTSCKDSCSGSCSGNCGSCDTTCSGGCRGSCKNTCSNSCSSKCDVQCVGSEQDTIIINLPDFPMNRKIFANDIIPLQKAIIYQCNRRKINPTTILSKQSFKVENEDINKMINDLNSIKINSIPFSLIEGQEIQTEEFKVIKEEIINRYNEFVKVD